MDDVELVEVLDTSDYLVEELDGLRFFDPLVLDDVIEKLSPTCILHDQVQLFRRLDDFIKLDDVWVPDHL